MPIKTLETSNMEDPEDHFSWALGLIPGIGQSPLIFPETYASAISKHLFELGFRHHPELQAKKWRRPYRGQQTSFNPAGNWVPMDDPDPEPVVLPNVNAFTAQENQAILDQYAASGMLDKTVEKLVEAEKARFQAFVVGEEPDGS